MSYVTPPCLRTLLFSSIYAEGRGAIVGVGAVKHGASGGGGIVFSCGTTLYPPMSVCVSVCLSVCNTF